MENDRNNFTQLQELGGSEFEIKDGGPDVRGWPVFTGNDERIGEVAELLFSPEERMVRYLIIDMDSNDLGMDDERLIIIPIGIAELHPENDDIIIPNVTSDQIRMLPNYVHGQVTLGMEVEIRSVFSGSETDSSDQGSFYTHRNFDENRFHKPRFSDSGLDGFNTTETSDDLEPNINPTVKNRDLKDYETNKDSSGAINEANEYQDRPDFDTYRHTEANIGKDIDDGFIEEDLKDWDPKKDDSSIISDNQVEEDDIHDSDEVDRYGPKRAPNSSKSG